MTRATAYLNTVEKTCAECAAAGYRLWNKEWFIHSEVLHRVLHQLVQPVQAALSTDFMSAAHNPT